MEVLPNLQFKRQGSYAASHSGTRWTNRRGLFAREATMKIRTGTNHEAGFTLIELLVVVSVIALLLAIMLPSLSAAHESGNMAVCGTRLNQIFGGAFLYASDNEERLPYFGWNGGQPTTPEWWATQVAQAMDLFETDIYTCPSDRNPHRRIAVYYSGRTISMVRPPSITTGKGKNRTTRLARSIQLPMTYRGACDLVETVQGNTSQARKISSWLRPSEALLLIEGRAQGDIECFRFHGTLNLMANGGRHPYQEDFERHLGQANYLFIDGHVDTLLPTVVGQMANNQEHYGSNPHVSLLP